MCNNDLDVFTQFRNDFIMKQKILYRELEQEEPDHGTLAASNQLKNESIECDEFDSSSEDTAQKIEDISQNHVVMMKSEEIEEEFEEFVEEYLEFDDTPVEESYEW